MKVSMKWINDYVDIKDISPKDYAAGMTMSGSMVEGIENTGEEISNVVVGKILSTEKHPDADKLQVCQVDVGSETTQIVTGAQNIKAGDLVPVALHKSTLPGGIKIAKGKLRGVVSNGMMCSHAELGMDIADYAGACEDGILIIQEDIKPGTDIKEALGLDENIVEFEITSNRADCFSVIGLARETAVTFGKELKINVPKATGNSENAASFASVEVADGDLCPRYAARIVKNVKIGPSPKWMVERLKSAGVRSINNVVDITNFVMLEYGQPMHAFDLSYLEDSKIIVRRADGGEKITTLDGEERTLDTDMLIIADGKKPVAVAGVMGGENSEIKDDTAAILFECANFNGASVRITAKKLGLRTEASSRYEKGLDPNIIDGAVNRACELMEMLGAGEVVGGIIDVSNVKSAERKIPFNPDKINAFLGTDIPAEFMVDTLKKLDFKVEDDICVPPTYRGDIEAFADVAEEVARIYGYDKIPSTLLKGETTVGGKDSVQKTEDLINEILVGMGGYEIMTYSFVNPKTFNMLCLPADDPRRNCVKILNPLGEENSIMRTTSIGSMMDILVNNYNYRNTSVRLYEIASIYTPTTPDKLPTETNIITIGAYGDTDFYGIKGMVEELFTALDVKNVKYVAETDNPTFHPGRTASIIINGKKAGVVGEIHPTVCENYSLPVKAYIAEIDFNTVFDNIDTKKSYTPLPKFPAVTRDIAVLVDNSVPVADLEDIIRKCGGKVLESLTLFDVYKGDKLPENKKSVAYSLALRSNERTLADEEIKELMNKILTALEEKTGAILR